MRQNLEYCQAVSKYLDETRDLLANLDSEDIGAIIEAILKAQRDGVKIFVLGNGGSASTASHFVTDLGKGVIPTEGSRFKMYSLTDNVPLITAWANDAGYERIFEEQLENLVEEGDVVIGISGSGNSPNVLRAMELARARRALAIGLTGYQGGKLKALCDLCVVVPSEHMDQIENVHMILQHLICIVSRDILLSVPALSAVNGPNGGKAW
jgi:D-sedoheptulose 7-phosphate isomerase